MGSGRAFKKNAQDTLIRKKDVLEALRLKWEDNRLDRRTLSWCARMVLQTKSRGTKNDAKRILGEA